MAVYVHPLPMSYIVALPPLQTSQQSEKMKKNKSSDAMSSYTKLVKMLYFKHVGSTQDIRYHDDCLEELYLLTEMIRSFTILTTTICPSLECVTDIEVFKPEHQPINDLH